MERVSNISVWQLRLFEGFDRDIMVMQRDEEEVFDEALHVFFEKDYYHIYVTKASKYGTHRYAYHEDKLGEVVNQVFEENIQGLVLHIRANDESPKDALCDERYLSAKDLIGLKDVADSYHHLYMATIERGSKEEAVAKLWTKYVYIIGQLPEVGKKPAEGEKPVFELMTLRRKKDGSTATAEDFDYESLKIFLTADSAMRFNADKKPINKYKLSMLSQLVRGKLQIIIEPHRNYWLEYDPAAIDLSRHLKFPHFDEETLKARVRAFFEMEQVYILLAPLYSDYRVGLGNPFLMKADEKTVFLYLFEKYDDAVSYTLQNPALLPVLDGIYPIGILNKNNKMLNLHTIIALADKIGVTGIQLDMESMQALGCKMEFFKTASEKEYQIDQLLTEEELSQVRRMQDHAEQYRFPLVPFYDQTNNFAVSEERKAELAAHMDQDFDQGITYLAGCSLAEIMVMMQQAAARFDKARAEKDEEQQKFYGQLMNRITIPLTELLCEQPYIYTLRQDNGELMLRNQLPYLVVTNRFEAGRRGEGRLLPVGIDNPQFMDKLCEAGKAAILTDGPSLLCAVDTNLMREVAKQWKRSEPLREELMIYFTQGRGLSNVEAGYYYRRLKSDQGIFIEFVSTVRNGAYPPMGMITINGHTAKDLAEAKNLQYYEAYSALLALKENSDESAADKEEADKEVDKQADQETGQDEEKKGLFGRLFKK